MPSERPRLTPAVADLRRAVRAAIATLPAEPAGPVLVALSGGADSLALAAAAAFECPRAGVAVRPVGVFNMSDEAGIDSKVIGVPAKDPRWAHIQDISDVPQQTRNEIEHFFEHYKDLEPGKWVKTEGWGDAAEAERIVQAGFDKLQAEGHGHGGEPEEDA